MSEAEPVVAVVDDDEDVRVALAFLLETAGYRVAAFASAEALLAAGPPAALACLLVDVRMPGGMDGLALLRELKARRHAAPVIVITGHGDVPLAVRAMRDGAFDFVEKPCGDEQLLGTVAAAIGAGRAEAGQRLLAADAAARVALLTPREREVLDALVAGQINKTIAHALGISPRTVEIHRGNVMEKLGVRSLGEAIRLAMLAGVVAR
jgi:two-component system response regulator FixJ